MKKWMMLFVLAAVLPASATIRYVSQDGTGDFTAIQAAINGSVAGDSIIVRGDQGAYNESPTADRRLVILGQGSGCANTVPTQLNGSFQFSATGSNTVLAGFYISGGQPIVLSFGASGVAVRRCRLECATGGWECIYPQGNTSAQIEESIVNPGTNTSSVLSLGGSNNSISFSNCILTGIDSTSRGFVNVTSTNTITLTNCDILNIYAMTAGSGGGTYFLDDNVFWQTTWNGNLNAGVVNASYNAITSSMTSFTGTNDITITSNPFVSWSPPHQVCTADVHLTAGSGLINAGDPNLAPDRDGSRRDPGVYGGPLNYEISGAVDYPFVTYFTTTPNVPQGGILELRTTGRVGRGQ